MLKDVIYLGLSQLAYLNWHILTEEAIERIRTRKLNDVLRDKSILDIIKAPNYDECWTQKDGYYVNKDEQGRIFYDKNDFRTYCLYSEDIDYPQRNPKFSDFSDWSLVGSYNHRKIRDKAGNIIEKDDSGFRVSVFKNENRIVIAFRGLYSMTQSEKRASEWLRNNKNINFKHLIDQFSCAAWTYDEILKLKDENDEIYISGHGIGACLAQFLFIYSGCNHHTKAWSSFGIGAQFDEYEIFSMKLDKKLFETALLENAFISDKYSEIVWNEKCLKASAKHVNELIKKYIELHEAENSEFDILEISDLEEIALKLKIIYMFKNYHEKARNNQKIENIYFSNKNKAKIRKKTGIITTECEEFEELEIYDEEKQKSKKILVPIVGNMKDYHSISNFLTVINDKGMIDFEKLNETYMFNMFKTLLMSEDVLGFEAEGMLKKGATDNYNGLEFIEEAFSHSDSDTFFTESIEKIKLMFVDIRSEFIKYKKEKRDWFQKDEKHSYLGRFANISDLGGVDYAYPKMYEHSKFTLEKLKEKLDPLSYNFLKNYNEEHWLHEELSPLAYAIDIVNPNKIISLRCSKVYVWNLAYKVFISERVNLDTSVSLAHRELREKNIDKMKVVFDKVIKSYTKQSYEDEVKESSAVWSKWGNMDKILKELKPEEQPEMFKFVESYKEAKEKAQEILERKRKERERLKAKNKVDPFALRLKSRSKNKN